MRSSVPRMNMGWFAADCDAEIRASHPHPYFWAPFFPDGPTKLIANDLIKFYELVFLRALPTPYPLRRTRPHRVTRESDF